MRLFIPITKIDEEKREVYGTLTQEIVDRDGEILDYESSKPFFEKWSGYFAESTNGKSVGNLRAMHRNVSAGKLTAIEFDDEAKAIRIAAKVVDDAEWAKCVEGVYTGFSAAGKVVKQWKDGVNRRYTANPYEASLADYPCVPTATFEYVKAGGVKESRPFSKSTAAAAASETDATFADVAGRRFKIDTPSHLRMSMALWSFAKVRDRYNADAQETIGRRLRDAARREKILVTEKSMLRGDFAKGLYDVGQLASFIDNLRWLQVSARYERESEQDDSPVPDQLLDAIASLTETLKEMVGEECDELLEILEYESGETFATSKVAGADGAVDFSKGVAKKHQTRAVEMTESAKTVHKAMTEVHKAMGVACKTMGDHCEKMAGFAGDLSGTTASTTSKVAGASTEETPMDDKKTGAEGAATTEKTAGAATAEGDKTDFAKLTERLESFEKRLKTAEESAATEKERGDRFEKLATDLAESGEQLLEALSGRPGVLKAVGKGEDAAATTTVEKTAGDKTPEAPKTPRDAFKAAFTKPSIQTGLPGERAAS